MPSIDEPAKIPPRISILVTTYNCAQYLPELCRSIQVQTYPNLEVLILDNGSTDHTQEVLSAFASDPRFRLLRWDQNRGFTPAFLELLKEGRGDYWVCPGADDVLFPGFLAQRLAVMQAHPEAAVVHGAAQIINETGQAIPSPFPPLNLPAHLQGRRGLEILLQHNVINFPSALVAYPATRKILPHFSFDWQYVPDWLLWILLAAAGHELVWDERPAHSYRIHTRSISNDPAQDAPRRAETRMLPLCALQEAAQFSTLAADYYARWRNTLYRLWLFRALKMRWQGLLQDRWLQVAAQAYYGGDHPPVGLLSEYVKYAASVAFAARKERQALRRQTFRVSGLAEINDPLFR